MEIIACKPRLVLNFTGWEVPVLQQTEFYPLPETNGGRTPGPIVFQRTVSQNTPRGFKWTAGVQALCICLIQYRCHPRDKIATGVPFVFEGDIEQPAKSLAPAFTKQAAWICHIFQNKLSQEHGSNFYERFIIPLSDLSKPRRNDSLRFKLNHEIIPPETIEIYVGKEEVKDEIRLLELADKLEALWYERHPQYRSRWETRQKQKQNKQKRETSSEPASIKVVPAKPPVSPVRQLRPSKLISRKEFVRGLRSAIHLRYAGMTKNPLKAASYRDMRRLTDYIKDCFRDEIGDVPKIVKGACSVAEGLLNPSGIKKIADLQAGLTLLVTAVGGLAIVWGLVIALGVGASIWTTIWATIAGTTGPLTGGLTVVGGVAAIVAGIYFYVSQQTPQDLSDQAFEVICKAIEAWADQKKAVSNDAMVKAKIGAIARKNSQTTRPRKYKFSKSPLKTVPKKKK